MLLINYVLIILYAKLLKSIMAETMVPLTEEKIAASMQIAKILVPVCPELNVSNISCGMESIVTCLAPYLTRSRKGKPI